MSEIPKPTPEDMAVDLDYLWRFLGGEAKSMKDLDPHVRIDLMASTSRAYHAEGRVKELEAFRNRAYLCRARKDGSGDHATCCLIWGDDGQGTTTEGKTNLECSCGALTDWYKRKHETAEAEAKAQRERADTARRVILDLIDFWLDDDRDNATGLLPMELLTRANREIAELPEMVRVEP